MEENVTNVCVQVIGNPSFNVILFKMLFLNLRISGGSYSLILVHSRRTSVSVIQV